MARVKELALEFFSVLSRLINVLTGGTADMTFSARSHRDSLWTEALIDWFAMALFREAEHCRRWWVGEVRRSRDTVAIYEQREVDE